MRRRDTRLGEDLRERRAGHDGQHLRGHDHVQEGAVRRVVVNVGESHDLDRRQRNRRTPARGPRRRRHRNLNATPGSEHRQVAAASSASTSVRSTSSGGQAPERLRPVVDRVAAAGRVLVDRRRREDNPALFTKGGPTERVWYYDLSDIKVTKSCSTSSRWRAGRSTRRSRSCEDYSPRLSRRRQSLNGRELWQDDLGLAVVEIVAVRLANRV